jgi:hypothetical protein
MCEIVCEMAVREGGFEKPIGTVVLTGRGPEWRRRLPTSASYGRRFLHLWSGRRGTRRIVTVHGLVRLRRPTSGPSPVDVTTGSPTMRIGCCQKRDRRLPIRTTFPRIPVGRREVRQPSGGICMGTYIPGPVGYTPRRYRSSCVRYSGSEDPR